MQISKLCSYFIQSSILKDTHSTHVRVLIFKFAFKLVVEVYKTLSTLICLSLPQVPSVSSFGWIKIKKLSRAPWNEVANDLSIQLVSQIIASFKLWDMSVEVESLKKNYEIIFMTRNQYDNPLNLFVVSKYWKFKPSNLYLRTPIYTSYCVLRPIGTFHESYIASLNFWI